MSFSQQLIQIHNATSSQELFEYIQSAIQSIFAQASYQIYFLDEVSGNLSLYFNSSENTNVHNDTAEFLKAELLSSEANILTPTTNTNHLIAAGKLIFQNSLYGVIAVHHPTETCPTAICEEKQKQEFLSVVSAISPEIIKVQLLESANQEAYLSLSKLNGIHASIDLIQNLDLDVILAKLMDIALRTINAEVGSIMILEENHYQTKIDFGFSDEVAQNLKNTNGQTYLQTVAQSEEATLILNTHESPLLEIQNLDVQLNSIISIPLRVDQKNLGILNIINFEQNFDLNSFEVLKTICNLSAYSLQNAILHKSQMESARLKESMEIAQQVQSQLLVTPHYENEGISVFGWNLACDETGGDYFDVFSYQDTSLEILVGDASGHGIGAAMTMIITRTALKTLYQQSLPKTEIFNLINNRLAADVSDEKFMTLFGGSIDFKTHVLSYISAGHDGPLLCRPHQPAEELASTGIPLGLLEQYPYDEMQTIPLQKGDILLLGSDGIWEAMDEHQNIYGKERLTEMITQNMNCSPRELIEKIKTDLLSFIGQSKIRDDMTLIIAKIM